MCVTMKDVDQNHQKYLKILVPYIIIYYIRGVPHIMSFHGRGKEFQNDIIKILWRI